MSKRPPDFEEPQGKRQKIEHCVTRMVHAPIAQRPILPVRIPSSFLEKKLKKLREEEQELLKNLEKSKQEEELISLQKMTLPTFTGQFRNLSWHQIQYKNTKTISFNTPVAAMAPLVVPTRCDPSSMVIINVSSELVIERIQPCFVSFQVLRDFNGRATPIEFALESYYTTTKYKVAHWDLTGEQRIRVKIYIRQHSETPTIGVVTISYPNVIVKTTVQTEPFFVVPRSKVREQSRSTSQRTQIQVSELLGSSEEFTQNASPK